MTLKHLVYACCFACLVLPGLPKLHAGTMSRETDLPSKSIRSIVCIRIEAKKSIFEKVAIGLTKKKAGEIVKKNALLSRENGRLNGLMQQMQTEIEDARLLVTNTNQAVATTSVHCLSLIDALAKRGQHIMFLKRCNFQLSMQVRALRTYYRL